MGELPGCMTVSSASFPLAPGQTEMQSWVCVEPPEHLGGAGGIEPGHRPERLTGKPVHEALFF